MLEKKAVYHYAQASQVDGLVAERDIILTYVLKVLSEKGTPRPLLHILALKGGTCMKKLYFGKTGRFSMDLDFTGTGSMGPEDFRDSLRSLFDGREYYGIRFSIEEEFARGDDATLSYGAVVNYAHGWSSGEFQIEVSFREEPSLGVVWLPLRRELYFRYCEFKPFEVPCLVKEELIAEKLRAAFQRLRSRDLYDLYLYSKTAYSKHVVKALVVIKCWNIREPFDPDLLLDRVATMNYDWTDLKRLVRPRQLPSEKEIVETIVSSYSYLREFDEGLKMIIADSRAHRRTEVVKSLTKSLTEHYRGVSVSKTDFDSGSR